MGKENRKSTMKKREGSTHNEGGLYKKLKIPTLPPKSPKSGISFRFDPETCKILFLTIFAGCSAFGCEPVIVRSIPPPPILIYLILFLTVFDVEKEQMQKKHFLMIELAVQPPFARLTEPY